jgi:Immunity protein 21
MLLLFRVADTEIFVLGDEPLRTTWVPNEKGGLLVRWVYADKEASVLEFLSDPSLDAALSASGVSFTTSGTCVLFDSAEPGDDIRGDSMALVLEPGTYAVKSAIVNPSAEVRLVIHQLRLISLRAIA